MMSELQYIDWSGKPKHGGLQPMVASMQWKKLYNEPNAITDELGENKEYRQTVAGISEATPSPGQGRARTGRGRTGRGRREGFGPGEATPHPPPGEAGWGPTPPHHHQERTGGSKPIEMQKGWKGGR